MIHPTWLSQELCAMLVHGVRDPSSLFHLSPVGPDSDRLALSLLFQYEQKKERVKKLSILSTARTPAAKRVAINKLTNRPGCFFRLCPISANSIISLRVRNGHTRLWWSTRLVKKELSDLWKVLIPEGKSISGPFMSEELAATPDARS